MTQASLTQTATLLAEVFPGSRIGDASYLRWLYEESPYGPVIESNRADELGPTAHYAVVPVALVSDGQPTSGALSLNTAVQERARGGGAFVTMAAECFSMAAERGVRIVVGVGNANSTHGLENRLGFINHGPLPATVVLPLPGRGTPVRSAWSDDAPELLDEIEPLLAVSDRGLTRVWTADTLAWRLRSPGSKYALHRSDDALVVSIREQRAGVSVAVILAVFASEPLTTRATRNLVRAVCRFHRAPAALYVGVNPRVRFRGPPLPRRLRPSPLNLVTRALDGATIPAPSRFEFLDFDAY